MKIYLWLILAIAFNMKNLSLVIVITLVIFAYGCHKEKVSNNINVVSSIDSTMKKPLPLWYSCSIDSLEMKFYDVAQSLGVPYVKPRRYSRAVNGNIPRYEDMDTKAPRLVYLRLMIDKKKLELNYVNYILKQELSKSGAIFLDGNFIVNWNGYYHGHKLTFLNKSHSIKYIIRIVYDDKPYINTNHSKNVSVIVNELGNNYSIVKDNIELLKEKHVSFAICIDSTYSHKINNMAKTNNIDVLTAIPLESFTSRYDIYRTYSIKVTNPLDPVFIQKQLDSFCNPLPNSLGLIHYWGNYATSENNLMKIVIDYCRKKDLIYIDTNTTSKTVAYNIALYNQVKTSKAFASSQLEQTLTNNDYLLRKYINSNTHPVFVVTLKNKKDVATLKKLINKLDKIDANIVDIDDLYKSQFPKID